MSEIVMSQDQYRETFPAQYREACADDPDNVGGKPFTLPAGDANHSDVITDSRCWTCSLVMFIGAARADADPTQRDRLKAEIPPLLEEYVHGGSPETVLRRVVEIMGPQWRPTGEWATWIDGLTKREAAE